MINLRFPGLHFSRTLVTMLLTVIPLALFAERAEAVQYSCKSRNQLAVGSPVEQAVRAWERSKQLQLTLMAKTEVASKFCGAAVKVARQLGLDEADTEETAGLVLPRYLSDNLLQQSDVISMSGLIASELALGATPSLPEPKMLGTIRIVYDQQVDKLIIDGASIPPWPTLLANVGNLDIRGVTADRIVCHGTISVRPTMPADFRC